jgi:diguanylate cyclase
METTPDTILDGGAEARAEVAARPATSGDPESAARRLRRAERLAVELADLAKTLCDAIEAVTGGESWVCAQTARLRGMLEGGIDHVEISELRSLLSQSVDMQRRIDAHRREVLAQIEATADRPQRGLPSSNPASAQLEREVSRLEEQLAAASAEMVTDHLTQTMNRRGLEVAFTGAVERALQSGESLALALLDIDDFKKLNDALGHHAGDEALRHLAMLLKERLRPSDAVARYGGEEFVVLLPGANLSNAQETLVRLQRELALQVFLHDTGRRFITFSAGVTMVRPDERLATAIGRADDAMYRAKRDGKNRVRVG